MLTKIIAFSIKNKLIIGLLTIALVIYGTYEVQRLPIDAVPDITNNQVQIITVAPALGATDVERLITFPIEQANNNLPGLKELRSFSRFGLSIVTVVLEDGVDVYWIRQQVSERLQQIQDELPQGLGKPFLAPVTTGLGEIYQYVVRPKKGYESKYDAMELRTIQDWIVRKQLIGVKGVADVSSFGGLLKQYEVAVVPEKLLAHKITINDVFLALQKNNQNTGGAYIEKGPTALFIRSEGLVKNLSDIETIVVKNLPNGLPLLIRDVAKVQYGHATRYGSLTYNGELQVSGAVVMMLKGANSNEVIASVKQRIEKIKKSLPEGVTIEPFIDRTKMVNNAIGTVTKNLMEGVLIVIFVLVLFLGNFRAGFLVASVIPLSMLFAIILMNVFGVSGNLMSLGALDFGLIVDGAVIIVEAVMHQMAHKKLLHQQYTFSQNEMDSEVNTSASKMMNSAVFGQIIILIVYLPIFTLQGIEGKMFRPMAQTVAFALLGAFVLSLTYIPMMSSLLLNKTVSNKSNLSDKLIRILENTYQKYILKALRHQKAILITVLSLFVFSVFLLTRLGGEFIPALPEGDYAVEARLLQGSSINTSIEVTSKAAKILLEKFPEVERVVTKTGSSEIPTDPMPIEVSDLIVVLKNRKDWTSAAKYEDLEAKMNEALKVIPGVSFSFQYPVAMRFNELISGARQDVVCKIFGENMDTLALYAKKVGRICTTVEGSAGIYVEAVGELPQINIQYNRNIVSQYCLSISDINSVVNAAFAGEKSGTVYDGEKRFDLVVRLNNEKRKGLSDVQNLLIPTPQGTQIPLSAVANVEIIDGPNQIQRENSQRRIIVGFNVRGRDVQSVVKELQDKIESQIKLSPGYSVSYGGAFENLENAKARLQIAVPVSLILIFLLLYFTFRSVKQGLLIYTAIPLSAIGGILALAIRGIPFSISAGVGFIALFGVAVLNGIILVAEFNRLKKEGATNLKRIVIQGTKIRLRPVLMTAFVASLGFLPMAISTGEGSEVQRPLASVVIGGLLIATLLTLFILPILYCMFHSNKRKLSKIASLIVLFIIATSQGVNAQTPINLKQAIDTALANNLLVKNEYLKSEYQEKLIKSGVNISSTVVNAEYGQINSFYLDKRFGVAQTINFPTVYARQKNVLTEEWKSSVLNVNVQQAVLKKQVSQLFYTLASLYDKRKLLLKTDTLYKDFYEKAKLRFDKGENNILEKVSAENQRGQIAMQLLQLEQDIEVMQAQFQLLLNTTTRFIPNENEAFKPIIKLNDSLSFELHPAIQYWKQQEEIASATTKLERSRLTPNITMAYNIMSMIGTGADNKTYNNIPRFQSGQIGLGIPLFSGGQRAKIRAAKTNELIASNTYEINLQQFEMAYQSAYLNYQKSEETVHYFEETALKNASIIAETAQQQLLSGAINYLEWMLLINQVSTVQNDYINAVKNRNLAAVELGYYINN